jgi:hypothetical protein
VKISDDARYINKVGARRQLPEGKELSLIVARMRRQNIPLEDEWSIRRQNIISPTDTSQHGFDRSAGRFPVLDENELVFVRYDHVARSAD